MRYLNHFFQILLRCIIILIPRNKKLVVYGGALDLFIDNAKYMYIYSNDTLKDYKHIWLTNNDDTYNKIKEIGLSVVKSYSLKGLFYSLRANTYVYDDDISFFSRCIFSTGAKKIQLWHGIPLKMCGIVRDEKPIPYYYKNWLFDTIIYHHKTGNFIISTSSKFDIIMSRSMRVPIDNVIHATYPRTIITIMPEDKRIEFLKKYEDSNLNRLYQELSLEEKRKVIYMPTFRDSNENYLVEAIPDWENLNSFCERNKIMLYVKVHRMTPIPNVCFSNVKVLDNKLDIYPILPLFDMLITDYSSIILDFILLKKPVCLYIYDLENYIANSRDLRHEYFEVKKHLPVARDFSELKDCILSENINISEFPINDYYEWPDSMDNIYRVICKS